MKHFINIFFGILISLGSLLVPLNLLKAEPTKVSLEYQIKASLTFKFLQFVTWPPEVFADSPAKIRLCIAGRDQFGDTFTVLERELIEGRKIEVSRFVRPKVNDLQHCHTIFFSKDFDENLSDILQSLKNYSILTIGESSGFLDKGGMINMSIEGERIVFDINRSTVLQARLDMSSKLLRIARSVKE